MQLHECILCTTAPIPSTSTSGSGVISLHDISTGTSLASFKQTSAGAHCTAVVESRDGQGGFMLAAQPDKTILNVYNYQKDQLALKIVLPEKLTALAVDPRGDYCAGGTAQGRIYLWETASGVMYNAWDAHYRQVTVLRFSSDGSALLSGSEDSGVSVWSVSRLLDDDLQNDLPTPYCTLTDHTLPVTDFICGAGGFPFCRILTASVDHSVKLWDLSSKSLLTTFSFPQPISCLAWDPTERLFFAASPDGSIHQMNLFRQREDKFGRPAMEAVGGTGVSDTIRINDDDPQAAKKRLISVGQPVTAMTMSLTSSLLPAGTSTGHIHIYDTASHQLLRTISTHKGMCITHLSTMLRPPDLVGHMSLNLSAGAESEVRDGMPVKHVAPFQRMRDAKTREAHEVTMILPAQTSDGQRPCWAYTKEELIRDHAFFVHTTSEGDSSSGQLTGISLQSRVSELEGEVTRLREQLGKAKGVNDVMWKSVVQRLVAEGREKEKSKSGEKGSTENGQESMQVDQQEQEGRDGERRRKRGRT